MRAYVEWSNTLLTHEAMAADMLVEVAARASVGDDAGGRAARPRRLPRLRRAGGLRPLAARARTPGCRFGKLPEVLLQWRDTASRLSRTDARYAPERFFDLKLESFLRASPPGDGLVVWGAGPIGKAWARGLADRGRVVRAFVEVDPRKIGQTIHGAPVVAVDAAGAYRRELHLAAVGPPRRPPPHPRRRPRRWGSSASSPWREIFDPHARSSRRWPWPFPAPRPPPPPPTRIERLGRIAALEDRRTLGRRRARRPAARPGSRHPPARRAGRRTHRTSRRRGAPPRRCWPIPRSRCGR